MSSNEQVVVSLLSNLALSFDGAVLGVALAYAAVRSILSFTSNSSALRKLRDAPSVGVSDLRSVLPPDDSSGSDDSATQPQPTEGRLVIVRGTVEPKSVIDGSWKSLKPNLLVTQETGDKAVVIQRTQTCIYNEWKGLFGWTSDLRTIFGRSSRERESTTVRRVPFILVEGGRWPLSDYVLVNMDGSRHPLPLTTVYHQLQPVNASPYTFLQALFGHEYPVGLLEVEKILPPGKDISAVGLCVMKSGIPEIKSCKDLPYFLTEMSKDQMIVNLALRTKVLFWSGVVLGSLSIGILGFSAMRWKEWRRRRRDQEEAQRAAAAEDADALAASEDDESANVPDGQLCVICLMRRRRSAFIPCGHLVCCQSCASSVGRDDSPKCPVCRQSIRGSVRIYDS
ncbi:hypothetical protein CRG98_037944 [Punica granatum]|uniref:RING-type E3 ubiquitin transferase n=1 Tax=Punica granatum TaxID=22663 RepID=A0A2I0ICC2_PUNGR|nr:hypothetical protein CRG98_037944 [Punica granatum]